MLPIKEERETILILRNIIQCWIIVVIDWESLIADKFDVQHYQKLITLFRNVQITNLLISLTE